MDSVVLSRKYPSRHDVMMRAMPAEQQYILEVRRNTFFRHVLYNFAMRFFRKWKLYALSTFPPLYLPAEQQQGLVVDVASVCSPIPHADFGHSPQPPTTEERSVQSAPALPIVHEVATIGTQYERRDEHKQQQNIENHQRQIPLSTRANSASQKVSHSSDFSPAPGGSSTVTSFPRRDDEPSTAFSIIPSVPLSTGDTRRKQHEHSRVRFFDEVSPVAGQGGGKQERHQSARAIDIQPTTASPPLPAAAAAVEVEHEELEEMYMRVQMHTQLTEALARAQLAEQELRVTRDAAEAMKQQLKEQKQSAELMAMAHSQSLTQAQHMASSTSAAAKFVLTANIANQEQADRIELRLSEQRIRSAMVTAAERQARTLILQLHLTVTESRVRFTFYADTLDFIRRQKLVECEEAESIIRQQINQQAVESKMDFRVALDMEIVDCVCHVNSVSKEIIKALRASGARADQLLQQKQTELEKLVEIRLAQSSQWAADERQFRERCAKFEREIRQTKTELAESRAAQESAEREFVEEMSNAEARESALKKLVEDLSEEVRLSGVVASSNMDRAVAVLHRERVNAQRQLLSLEEAQRKLVSQWQFSERLIMLCAHESNLREQLRIGFIEEEGALKNYVIQRLESLWRAAWLDHYKGWAADVENFLFASTSQLRTVVGFSTLEATKRKSITDSEKLGREEIVDYFRATTCEDRTFFKLFVQEQGGRNAIAEANAEVRSLLVRKRSSWATELAEAENRREWIFAEGKEWNDLAAFAALYLLQVETEPQARLLCIDQEQNARDVIATLWVTELRIALSELQQRETVGRDAICCDSEEGWKLLEQCALMLFTMLARHLIDNFCVEESGWRLLLETTGEEALNALSLLEQINFQCFSIVAQIRKQEEVEFRDIVLDCSSKIGYLRWNDEILEFEACLRGSIVESELRHRLHVRQEAELLMSNLLVELFSTGQLMLDEGAQRSLIEQMEETSSIQLYTYNEMVEEEHSARASAIALHTLIVSELALKTQTIDAQRQAALQCAVQHFTEVESTCRFLSICMPESLHRACYLGVEQLYREEMQQFAAIRKKFTAKDSVRRARAFLRNSVMINCLQQMELSESETRYDIVCIEKDKFNAIRNATCQSNELAQRADVQRMERTAFRNITRLGYFVGALLTRWSQLQKETKHLFSVYCSLAIFASSEILLGQKARSYLQIQMKEMEDQETIQRFHLTTFFPFYIQQLFIIFQRRHLEVTVKEIVEQHHQAQMRLVEERAELLLVATVNRDHQIMATLLLSRERQNESENRFEICKSEDEEWETTLIQFKITSQNLASCRDKLHSLLCEEITERIELEDTACENRVQLMCGIVKTFAVQQMRELEESQRLQWLLLTTQHEEFIDRKQITHFALNYNTSIGAHLLTTCAAEELQRFKREKEEQAARRLVWHLLLFQEEEQRCRKLLQGEGNAVFFRTALFGVHLLASKGQILIVEAERLAWEGTVLKWNVELIRIEETCERQELVDRVFYELASARHHFVLNMEALHRTEIALLEDQYFCNFGQSYHEWVKSYLVLRRHFGLSLADSIRYKTTTRRGVPKEEEYYCLRVVGTRRPAFPRVLEDDVILAVNDKVVFSLATFSSIIATIFSLRISLTLLREGNVVETSICADFSPFERTEAPLTTPQSKWNLLLEFQTTYCLLFLLLWVVPPSKAWLWFGISTCNSPPMFAEWATMADVRSSEFTPFRNGIAILSYCKDANFGRSLLHIYSIKQSLACGVLQAPFDAVIDPTKRFTPVTQYSGVPCTGYFLDSNWGTPAPSFGPGACCVVKMNSNSPLCTSDWPCGNFEVATSHLMNGCCKSTCISGYTGSNCDQCATNYGGDPCRPIECGFQHCNYHATSVTGNLVSGCTCVCTPLYLGPTCATARSCTNAEHCNNHASAVSGDVVSGCKCTCEAKYQQPTCTPILCTNSSNCNSAASSVSGTLASGCVCQCLPGYSGATCTPTRCTNIQNCNGHADAVTGFVLGKCNCNCSFRYAGNTCSLCAEGLLRYPHCSSPTQTVSASSSATGSKSVAQTPTCTKIGTLSTSMSEQHSPSVSETATPSLIPFDGKKGIASFTDVFIPLGGKTTAKAVATTARSSAVFSVVASIPATAAEVSKVKSLLVGESCEDEDEISYFDHPFPGPEVWDIPVAGPATVTWVCFILFPAVAMLVFHMRGLNSYVTGVVCATLFAYFSGPVGSASAEMITHPRANITSKCVGAVFVVSILTSLMFCLRIVCILHHVVSCD